MSGITRRGVFGFLAGALVGVAAGALCKQTAEPQPKLPPLPWSPQHPGEKPPEGWKVLDEPLWSVGQIDSQGRPVAQCEYDPSAAYTTVLARPGRIVPDDSDEAMTA